MLKNDSFDIVISGQAFEHIEFFWFTLGEMVRVLKPSGLMCIIVPRGSKRHGYPVDCYRFDVDGVIALAKYGGLRPLHASTSIAPPGASDAWYSIHDSMLVAEKPLVWRGLLDPMEYKYTPNNYEKLATGFITKAEQNQAPHDENNALQMSLKHMEFKINRIYESHEILKIEHAALQETSKQTTQMLENLTKENKTINYEVNALKSSTSWRITAPFRSITRFIRRR